jgi:preprotein translocase subunit SecB
MADQNPALPGANGAKSPDGPPPQVRIVAQYIKDLSFENPNVEKLIGAQGGNPNLNVEVNVGAKRLGQPDLYESLIDLSAKATNAVGVVFEMQVVYAGVFEIKNIPPQALEPFLLINCPTVLFPFARRLAADLTREAGYPALFLDPIDFAALYVERRRKQAQSSSSEQANS